MGQPCPGAPPLPPPPGRPMAAVLAAARCCRSPFRSLLANRRKADDLVHKRHLILMRTGQRRADHRPPTGEEVVDIVRRRAFAVERTEDERETVRSQGAWPVHDV